MNPALLAFCFLAGAANTAVLTLILEHRYAWARPLAVLISVLAIFLLVPAALAILGGLVAPRTQARQRFLASFCGLQFLGLAAMGVNMAQGRVTVRQWLASLGAATPAPTATWEEPTPVTPPPELPPLPSVASPTPDAGPDASPPGDLPPPTSAETSPSLPAPSVDSFPAAQDTAPSPPRFLYQYEARGTAVVVDSLEKVPPRYRSKVVLIPLEDFSQEAPAVGDPAP